MTTAHKLELAAAVLALVCVFGRGWEDEQEYRAKAQANATAQEQKFDQAAAEQRGRDAATAQLNATLARQAAAVTTPQKAAQVILRYLPAPAAAAPGQAAPAPAPIVTVDRTQLSPELQKSLPDATTFTMLTPAQAEGIARNDLQCAADRNDLATCRADATDLHSEIAARTSEADTWKAAAKGGTKFQRFVRVLKFTACAGAGAGVGALADKHSPATGAAIGGAVGVGGCSLF